MNQRSSMTNAQVAEYLNVDKSTLYRWRRNGRLQATRRDRQGWFVYDRATVELFKERERSKVSSSNGQREAQAYRLFKEGKEDREIVMLLQLSHRQVQRLRLQYDAPGGWLLSPELRQRVVDDLKRIGLHAQSAAELCAWIRRLVDDNLRLTREVGLLLADRQEARNLAAAAASSPRKCG